MFDNLTDRLGQTLKQLRGQARLSDENIKNTLREVRVALLEADVALPVVRDFITKVQDRAVGQEVVGSLTPGQAFIKVVYDELVDTMGESTQGLKLDTRPPAIILVAGLQGSGKTTTVAKLARWLTEQKKKSVLITSADIYRPAAIQQLETLANEIGVHFYPSQTNQSPITIARGAIRQAQIQMLDVLIVDTAGRLHVDDEMMTEIKELHQAISPVETLFVVDSMTGQDAANTARAFNEALDLTGVVLTKVDGDARGGAALSIRHITGKPIKFIGLGEKTTALELFHPDRIASRILGMGDVLSLVEEVERQVDKEQAEKLAKKLKKGKGFDLEDFRLQLQQMNKMGGIASLLDKLPTMNLPANAVNKINDKEFVRLEAIINSMTFQERRQPEIIKGSRKKRISTGSGTQVQDVNRLLKQFTQMQKMMKKMSKGGKLAKLMGGMSSKAMPRLPF
ncbi:signal recognition particle protein [Candidatus Nitrosacidococcus tergens]|uniref:Signal recognition particle protein n=1 Tax=Candidatus Nitrosacidococcus tergens TaxID=553981 RepID=A0A7G1Q8I3_9GAMM|nr:signal recognition particle protein [Candidatus Nitrosacidococcus tergens]CAB1275159.1 4.5S-RNP protein, GTP binding export factor, part of signal recognition particle with 4.5 RNA [Candidatus Nitrosacidococcus tergens]